MERSALISKAAEKLRSHYQLVDPLDKFYRGNVVQRLINQGCKQFPNYNLDEKEADQVVDFVLQKLPRERRSEALKKKIKDGIT